jgi:hypothetical protein
MPDVVCDAEKMEVNRPMRDDSWQFVALPNGRLGLRVSKSPLRTPTANAIGERVIGTIRRECLDWLIPLSEAHLSRR